MFNLISCYDIGELHHLVSVARTHVLALVNFCGMGVVPIKESTS